MKPPSYGKLFHSIIGSFMIVLILPRIINFSHIGELFDNDPYPSPTDEAYFNDEMNDLTITKIYLPFIPQGPPLYSKSWYVETVDTQFWFGEGCEKGNEDRLLTGKQDSIVILDFNYPTYSNGVFGAKLFGFGSASITAIAAAVEYFGIGYYNCVQPDTTSTLRIAVGTNNCGQAICTDSISSGQYNSHGVAWAEMVNTIGSYLINNGYYQQVSAFGASDMEVGWNDPYTTRQWVWGYQNANNWPMYNFGDAQGCPQVRSIPNFNAPCDNGWYQFTIWDISWGISAAFPLPLIYDNDGVNGRQWYSLSAYGYDLQNGRIDIQGVVTQSYACSQRPCNPNVDNTPQEGYMDLNSALTSDPNTFQGIKWSADLGYSGY